MAEQWQHHFLYLEKMTLSTKLRFFQIRLAGHKLVTNYLQNKWDPSIDKICSFCQVKVEMV